MIEIYDEISVERSEFSKIGEVKWEDIPFGIHFTDHMFTVDYESGQWKNARIIPYGNISIAPSIAGLHYGQCIFEGMKAYRSQNGEIDLFRPLDNIQRMNKSAKRMNMPEMPESLFMNGLIKLLETDNKWVPDHKGSSLYIRPLMFATEERIMVKPSEKFKFIIIASPAGNYYGESVKVMIENNYSRACMGGVGFAKAAGNYGASMYPTQQAREKGFQQVIWTDSSEHKYIEEAGTMNIFFVIEGKLITPLLSETKLAGITRNSFILLAKDEGIVVEERKVSVDEIILAAENKQLTEVFGTGTAVTMVQIDTINFNHKDYVVSKDKQGGIANKLTQKLFNIRYGLSEDIYGWMYKVT